MVASLIAEHGLQTCGLSSGGSPALELKLSSCGAWAQLLCSTWDLPRSGIKPLCPALAREFFTTDSHQGSPCVAVAFTMVSHA